MFLVPCFHFAVASLKKFCGISLLQFQSSLQRSADESRGPSGQSLSQFLKHETTRSISTPPWMGCIKFASNHLYTWVERGTESKVSVPRIQHNVPKMNGLTMRPLCLPIFCTGNEQNNSTSCKLNFSWLLI